jgi:hypothetical protein
MFKPQQIPGPPFEKFVYFTLCDRARDVLEVVDDVVPE